MKMSKLGAFAISLTLGLGLVSVTPAFAGDKAAKKGFAADKGASSVDVSGFTDEMKANYKVFATRCSKCHTLARPINTDMATKAWKMYVKRMMNKPDSGISPANGKKIYKFLKFYQAQKDAKKTAAK